MLGITRSADTTGITGFDAVRLWHEYERGSADALELLLKYNRDDIVNLETIIEMMHPKFVKDALSAAGGLADVNRHPHQIGRVWEVLV